MEEKKKPVRSALGRGLSALISQAPVPVSFGESTARIIDMKPVASKSESVSVASPQEGLVYVSPSELQNNPSQPRQEFKEAELVELAASVKKLGLLQPIVARRLQNGVLEIVAGERRWRASKLAGVAQVPVIVKELNDRDALEIAIVENVQRENLNPIEQAVAYQRLIDEFSLSQEDVADRVGKDRTSVTNVLRLLKLPREVQQLVQEGKISMGHAKAILSIKDANGQLSLARKVINEQLSVRALEGLVSRVVILDAGKTAKERRTGAAAMEKVDELSETQERLRRALGTKIALRHQANGKGAIVIEYFSEAELERIVERICAN